MPSQRANKTEVLNSKRLPKLTDYFSRKTADATTPARSSSPLSSLSSSPAPVPDRGPVKNDAFSKLPASSTTRKSSRLSALKGADTSISAGPSIRTSASIKSANKSSPVSVGAHNTKPDPKSQDGPRTTRYRTRQTDSNGASSSKPQQVPSTKARSISLQVHHPKSFAKRKKPPSCNSDVEESDDVHIPRVTFSNPSVMKENLPPVQDDRPSLSPASKRLKLGPACSAVYAPSSISEEHELALPPSVKRLPEVRENVRRWRATSISFPPPPLPDVEMDDVSVQGDIDDEPMEDDPIPSSQSQPYLESVSRILPTPSPELPAETLSKFVSLASSSLTPLETTPAHQSPITPPSPSSPPRKSSVSYRPLSPPPSDFPEEPMADVVEDHDDFIARMKAEVAAEVALNLPDSDCLSVPGDLSDDSSGEEELHWSPAPTKASTSTPRTTPIPVFSNSGRPVRQHKAPAREPVVITKAPKKTANPLKELLKQHRKAEKGGYGAGDLRRAEEHINAIKNMKIDDPLEPLHQDFPSSSACVLKQEGSTSAILDDQAVMSVLGEDKGTMVGRILQDDKRNRIVRRREVDPGIELFDRTEGCLKSRTLTGDVKLVMADTSDVVFRRFKNLVEMNDVPAVRLMLDYGALKRIKTSNCGACLRWLLEQAFTSSDKVMREAAYHALSVLRSKYPLPLTTFASTLVTLGAKPDVLKAAGFDIRPTNVQYTRMERELLLREWLILVERLSCTMTFDDVSGMITLLSLIVLDRSLAASSKRLATAAIGTITERRVSPQIERFVCTSLLKLASNMSISNQASLVVALGNGSPTIRRISRWLSAALIIEDTTIPEDLNSLVPTSKIRGYLESPQAGLMEAQESEEIDFENVTNKVALLSVALTDITRQTERVVGAGLTDLNAVSAQLANLHAKIVDTRAAHLDRSRAKAALQTLSFRIRYQVAAAQDSSLHRGKLQAYWAPTNSQ